MPTASFESIATVTVGSGGSTSVSFTSIPSTYTHLQIRVLSQSSYVASADLDGISMRFNSDTGSNYADHYLRGTGAAVSGVGNTSGTYIGMWQQPNTSYSTNPFSAGIIDILDYTNTNKYKTIRYLGGADTNNSGNEVGRIQFGSGLWMSTSAVTSITFQSGAFNRGFLQYSHFALYGIKSA